MGGRCATGRARRPARRPRGSRALHRGAARGGRGLMAARGDEVQMTISFERPLTSEKVAERCRAIADHLEDDDE
ncbi:hypothetical protein BBD46_01490 [Natrialba sp. SSL1]|nr:hypothetical protein BBD46_01490 [Natrialba sp. SSL1]